MNNSVIERLWDFCQSKGYLKAYKDDLFVHDANYFERLSGWKKFIWLGGETFTHLFPVGLHANINDWANSALNVRGKSRCSAMLIDLSKPEADQIKEISLEAGSTSARGIIAKEPVLKLVDTVITGKMNGAHRFGYLSLNYQMLPMQANAVAYYSYTPPCEEELGSRALSEGIAKEFASCEACASKGMWTHLVHQNDRAGYEENLRKKHGLFAA